MNYQDNIASVHLWTDCSIVVGRLYDEAFVQRQLNGSSTGGFASAEFNGKEISCTIVPRYMKNGSWSSTTRWKWMASAWRISSSFRPFAGHCEAL